MEPVTLVILLLAVVTILAMAARKVNLPYPTVMVIGGLAIGFIPGLPVVHLNPNLVFELLLPPLLYAAAWQTSWRDFRQNLRPITLLAVGFVAFNTIAVGAAAHWLIPGMGWGPAFVLGAIISPPDAVAAAAITQRLGVPRRIIVVLEGESLVNDATGLSIFQLALVATLTGSFNPGLAVGTFIYAAAGGVLAGIAIAMVFAWVHKRLDEPLSETVITLLTPFAIFFPCEAIHVSPFLAIVAAGVYLGRRSSELFGSELRIQAYSLWRIIVFVLNGVVFVMIGLQLPAILHNVRQGGGESWLNLLCYALAVSLITVVVRFIWVFPATYLPRWLSKKLRTRDPAPSWKAIVIVAYTAMRGVVSLAAALALPLAMPDGTAFPQRDLILFLTFAVIMFTLVVQSLTLPPLIRRLGLRDDGNAFKCEEWEARARAARAALARIAQMLAAGEVDHRKNALDRMKGIYEDRITRLVPTPEDANAYQCVDEDLDMVAGHHRTIRREILRAEHRALIDMRNKDEIDDETLRRIEHDLDLELLRAGA